MVEDEDAVRDTLALFLADTYDVEPAKNAAQALAFLRRESVVVVVLDHRLPDRSGLDILPEIQSLQPGVPVVMMTGFGSEMLCVSAFRHGVKDYLPKPVHRRDLVAAVGRAVGGSSAADARVGDREPSDPPLARGRGPDDARIQQAINLIEKRYWDELRLSVLAREVGMSTCGLSHRFTEVMGLSFRKYLLIVRLERSKELLAAGQASITEVAQAVGFGDLPRFDKLFKRYTGLTPSAYRSRMRLVS
jgi:YesN/AraC family two-component response regulator